MTDAVVSALLVDLPSEVVRLADGAAMARLADTRTPQGVVGIVALPLPRIATDDEVLLILDGVQDPGNTGTIVRSALASGVVGGVVCLGGADPFGPRAIRASAGAVFAVPPQVDPEDSLDGILRNRRLIGASAGKGELYDRLAWTEPIALAVGSEGHGLSRRTSARVDTYVQIPTVGAISLNAAIATSILVFHIARERSRCT